MAHKFPAGKQVLPSMTTYLSRLEELLPKKEPKAFHPTVAKGVALLPVEFESFFKAAFVNKLAVSTNFPPPPNVWEIVFNGDFGIQDILMSLRPEVSRVTSEKSRRFVERISTTGCLFPKFRGHDGNKAPCGPSCELRPETGQEPCRRLPAVQFQQREPVSGHTVGPDTPSRDGFVSASTTRSPDSQAPPAREPDLAHGSKGAVVSGAGTDHPHPHGRVPSSREGSEDRDRPTLFR
jgi:hypothetical protein